MTTTDTQNGLPFTEQQTADTRARHPSGSIGRMFPQIVLIIESLQAERDELRGALLAVAELCIAEMPADLRIDRIRAVALTAARGVSS